MSYVNRMLLPDERVVYAAVIHWIIFLPGLALALIGGVIGFYAPALASFSQGMPAAMPVILDKVVSGAGLVCSLVGFAFLLGAFIRQSATELVITNRRIIAKYGFISRSTFEIMLNRVTGVNFDQTVMGRILGFGTILVHGAGGDISPFDVMSNPQLFQRALMDEMEHGRR